MHSQFRNTIEHHKEHHEHQRNLWKKHYAYEVYTFQRHKPAGFAYSHLTSLHTQVNALGVGKMSNA